MALIAPHGADELRPLIVDDARRSELEAEALTLPSLMISSAAAANAVICSFRPGRVVLRIRRADGLDQADGHGGGSGFAGHGSAASGGRVGYGFGTSFLYLMRCG